MEMGDEVKKLVSVVGNEAYSALSRGNPMKRWRGSTPHNWFIENENGATLWHIDDKFRQIPSLELFKKPVGLGGKIPSYWGSDSGKSRLSLYTLKEKYRRSLSLSSDYLMKKYR